MPTNTDKPQVEGVILENLPNTTFRVQVGGQVLLCHMAGKMRLHWVRVLPGDRVLVETNPYDATRGRIVYKIK